MAAPTTTTAAPQPPLAPAGRLWSRWDLRSVAPTLFIALNAVAFLLIQPGVPDLWAARARASAAREGVGLTYWFGWFSGGATPGNYSVVTPYLCAAIGTELLCALAAVVAMALISVLVRGVRYETAAAWAGAVGMLSNLWSARVPFLLGSVFALGALIALRRGKRAATVGLTLLSVLATPTPGAFLVIGLSGTFLTTRTKAYRPIIAYAVVTVGVALLGVLVLFGGPGPEPFNPWLVFELAWGLGCLWLAWPADHIRTTLWVSVLALLALWLIPNGLGSNYARFIFAPLPVMVLATSQRRQQWAVLAVAPALVMGIIGTSFDLVHATAPVSSPSYYKALVTRLDQVGDMRNYRLEVVNHGAHTGDDTLINHFMLARGWETQEDTALNKVLLEGPIDPITYKVWLDNNAVGYVALPTTPVKKYPEYQLVKDHPPRYLHRIWSSHDWQLFRVDNPTRIVGQPGAVLAHEQKSMTISVPCACTLPVRVRWSKFLAATLQVRDRHGELVDAVPQVQAKVNDDGMGWTKITTTRPGTYVMRGSIMGLLH